MEFDVNETSLFLKQKKIGRSQYLLGIFQQKKALTFGIEPTDANIDAKGKGHIIFNEYLSEQLADIFVNYNIFFI